MTVWLYRHPWLCILDNIQCSINAVVCEANTICNTIPGFEQCVCKVGFTGDGIACSGKSFSKITKLQIIDTRAYIL